MPTTAEKLWEAARTLPESLQAEVLDFAEFLRAKRGFSENSEPSERLSALCGGLESSVAFAADPMTIQRQLRDEWN
jgi:hypothetical protein